MKMNRSELLLTLLHESVEECYANDRSLIERRMEQSCVARIYYYMQKAIDFDDRFIDLRDFNLDSEYYKNGQNSKKTESFQHGAKPDVILHQRECNSNNLLIVEFKTAVRRQSNDVSRDFKKLEAFTKDSKYSYFLGVFIDLNINGPRFTYFQAGQEKLETELSNEKS